MTGNSWAQKGSVIRLAVGQVQVRRAGSTLWEAASTGTRLTAGDAVRTLGDGRCELTLAGNRTLRVESNASLTIPKSKYNSEESIGYVDLLFGKLWAGIKGLRSGSTRFVIRTPNALGGVKGTTFWVTHDRMSGNTDWALLEGKLEILSRRKGVPSTVLSAGEQVRVNKFKMVMEKQRFDPAPGLKAFRRFFFQKSAAPMQQEPTSPKVAKILAEELKLVNSLRRFSNRPAVSANRKAAPAMVTFSNKVVAKSQSLGLELERALRGLPAAAARSARQQYKGHHGAILNYYRVITGSPYNSAGTQNTAPQQNNNQPTGRNDKQRPQKLGFLRQGINEMNMLARKIAATPKHKAVPRGLYRRLDSTNKKVTRKYSKLRPITPEAQKMYNDFTRARQRVFIVIKRRGGIAPSSGGSDPIPNTEPPQTGQGSQLPPPLKLKKLQSLKNR